MLKAKPVSIVAEREKMPFEVTPFVIYLSREQSRSTPAVRAVGTESNAAVSDAVDPSAVDPAADTK